MGQGRSAPIADAGDTIRTVQGGPESVPAMAAGDLDDVPNGGGREWAAFENTATYQIFGEAWRDRIERNRRAMTFSEGKRLAHRVFNTLGMPRPYVKCMPGHYPLLGYATPEWEIFIRQETWDDTVLHEAAHLMFWENAGGQPDGDIMEGHSLVWFSNYVVLLLEFGGIDASHVKAFALDVIGSFGAGFPKDFDFAFRGRLEGYQKRWAGLKPGDRDYRVAVSAGCRLHSKHEPLPHRDAA